MSAPPLTPPPIRVCLEDATSRAAGGRNDPVPVTEKLWYLYWQSLGERVSGLVGYGRADQRPDAGSVPDGGLYMQIDPGYVIYQSIAGEWHYVAGTMYGTLSPDQRPVGLGPNDAGFDFRAVDSDPQYSGREFIWSGSVWVESTPARYGTHAAGLALVAAQTVNAMLWVETDRSEVIYQNQGGTWHYLAGTMWGTISPDQRPTDLGVNDAGFSFRSIDTAPLLGGHEWLWSGTDWVETTPNRYGTHAARLALAVANIWNGMLWVETDRSGVIYQNQSGVWHFLAGTMWGTLTPDQRPTDLGVNDAGFDFRATDVPREFIWSGTAWVEATPVTGAANLTHPNVVTKVGATPGQIVEGGITDLSAANSERLHITSGGNVGVNTPNPLNIFQVRGALNQNLAIRYDGSTVGLGAFNDAGSTALPMHFNGTGYLFIALRSTNPGPASQQIWYDPATGNVKYTP